MRLLRDSALSRADLARRSGLAKATIGTMVSQPERAGAVSAGETESSGRGRPSTPLVLAGRSLAGLGIEINLDYAAVTVVDLGGRELSFEEHGLDRGARRLEEVVAPNLGWSRWLWGALS